MKYELVLFDADGTLFDFEKASEEALKNGFQKFEIKNWNSETMTIYRKVNKQIWDEFELKLISAADLKAERFRRFFIEISVENINPKKFSDDYLLFLSQSTDLIEGAEDLVKWCYGKFKLGIITNGLSSVQKPRFNNSILDKYFDHYIISEEIGFAKPNAEIFDYSFEKQSFDSSDRTAGQSDVDRKTDIHKIRFTVSKKLKSWLSMDYQYNYTKRKTDFAAEGYVDNKFSVALTARY